MPPDWEDRLEAFGHTALRWFHIAVGVVYVLILTVLLPALLIQWTAAAYGYRLWW